MGRTKRPWSGKLDPAPVETRRLTTPGDDFEISSAALDAVVESAMASADCFGARMTGGGFGGSFVALVGIDRVDTFVSATLARYRQSTGLQGEAIPTRPTTGTSAQALSGTG